MSFMKFKQVKMKEFFPSPTIKLFHRYKHHLPQDCDTTGILKLRDGTTKTYDGIEHSLNYGNYRYPGQGVHIQTNKVTTAVVCDKITVRKCIFLTGFFFLICQYKVSVYVCR
ncbi:hypothetical protein GOODEAATRI_020807 [Goodea atripinnis]|uniref:Uncharacterized protein n=1 Tax=Goodea atripinnis TaxID=208336 RepID=A0ABV0PQA2_9TELE